MNGVRSIFRRKGYLLTALAAAVLLAASSGTAWAQATITIESVSLSAATVNEGGEATATVKFTVTNGTDEAIEPANATVGFEFNAETTRVGATNASATQATAANFIGLSDTGGPKTRSSSLWRGSGLVPRGRTKQSVPSV